MTFEEKLNEKVGHAAGGIISGPLDNELWSKNVCDTLDSIGNWAYAEAKKEMEEKMNKVYLLALSQRRGSGIGGQAITEYSCFRCDGRFAHANTATPIFCPECRKHLLSLTNRNDNQGAPK